MGNPFMARAIELSIENVRAGRGGPFAAVIVKGGEIVAEAANAVTSANDPTAHAEIMAIREACRKLGTFELEDCEMYATCEPCPMCLGAIYWARLARVYFAALSADASAGRIRRLVDLPRNRATARGTQNPDDSDDARRGAGRIPRLGSEER